MKLIPSLLALAIGLGAASSGFATTGGGKKVPDGSNKQTSSTKINVKLKDVTVILVNSTTGYGDITTIIGDGNTTSTSTPTHSCQLETDNCGSQEVAF